MKAIWIAGFAAVMAFSTGCFRNTEVVFKVEVPRLKSEECASIIQRALAAVEGVVSATPDFEARTITVKFNSEKVARKNIEFVIAGVGFRANEVPPKRDAMAKLPEECRE